MRNIIPEICKVVRHFKIVFFSAIIFFCACSPGHEVIQPFKNLGYSGERLFPVQTNFSEFTFRIWLSNSSSIDRVITVYKDSGNNFLGNLVEFGSTYNRKYKSYYNKIDVVPKSGFDTFKQKLDSLNLFEMTNRESIPIVLHEPISTFVVEIKEKNKFNTFRFDLDYGQKILGKNKYEQIVKLINDEFDLEKYSKFIKK
ncbi:MAG: hypothetical protein ABI653_03170 [Bacteroidota bacterium]